MDGLHRWNEDRERAATSLDTDHQSYSGLLRHTANVLGLKILKTKIAPTYNEPRKFTGIFFLSLQKFIILCTHAFICFPFALEYALGLNSTNTECNHIKKMFLNSYESSKCIFSALYINLTALFSHFTKFTFLCVNRVIYYPTCILNKRNYK